jgi:peptidoglycan hydrolase-like protein with peptidoglycan-binding domain
MASRGFSWRISVVLVVVLTAGLVAAYIPPSPGDALAAEAPIPAAALLNVPSTRADGSVRQSTGLTQVALVDFENGVNDQPLALPGWEVMAPGSNKPKYSSAVAQTGRLSALSWWQSDSHWLSGFEKPLPSTSATHPRVVVEFAVFYDPIGTLPRNFKPIWVSQDDGKTELFISMQANGDVNVSSNNIPADTSASDQKRHFTEYFPMRTTDFVRIWRRIRLDMTANTPGKQDGTLLIDVDGQRVRTRVGNFTFRTTSTKFNRVKLGHYLSTPDTAKSYIDNVAIWVGSGTGGTTPPTSTPTPTSTPMPTRTPTPTITPTRVPTTAPIGYVTLRRGDQGETVRVAQFLLRQHGFSTATDGVFGAQTEEHVKAFQRSNGLTQDGVIGPSETWPKLVVTVQKDSTKAEAVRAAQTLLRKVGYPTVVDGVFGPVTHEHTVAFQKSRGLVADGVIGPSETWPALVGAAGR